MSQQATGRVVVRPYRTTIAEHVLLIAMIGITPLENYIPTVGGFSGVWIVFGASGCYLILKRFSILSTILSHPLFLAGYVWLGICVVIESLHPLASYVDLVRAAQMFVGAAFVASLCRDRKGLYRAICGYLLAGVGLAIVLYLTSYGALSAVTAADFTEASHVREEVLSNNPLEANLNQLAFLTAQGVVVALALTLTEVRARRRLVLLGIALFSLVAAFLPMSRSAVLTVVFSSAIVMFASRKVGKVALVGCFCVAAMVVLVPESVWSRMTLPGEASGGEVEARVSVYSAVLDNFAEYAVTGVGAGNFWESWHYERGFIAGAHNVYFQVAINWGMLAVMAFALIVLQAYRCIPSVKANDGLALCVLGIAASLLVRSLFMHNFYAKEFALGLGLLVASRKWIWPRHAAEKETRR